MAIVIVANQAQPLGQERPRPWADHFLSSQPRLSQPLHNAQHCSLLTCITHYTLTRIFCVVSFLHCLHRFCHLCTFTLNLGRENESAGSEDSLIARVPLLGNTAKFFSVARFLFLIENNQSLHTYIYVTVQHL